MTPFAVNLLGYFASFVILVSLLMKSIVKLRLINAAGSVLFIVFAVLTRSWPTVVMNAGIVAIDLWFVFTVTGKKDDYRLVDAEPGSAWLVFFCENNRDELQSLFGPDPLSGAEQISYFVCNGEIAGLFAWKQSAPGECRILVDYVTPRYRDTRIGRYFFDRKARDFRERGFVRLAYVGVGPGHWEYLRRIGFRETEIGSFMKTL